MKKIQFSIHCLSTKIKKIFFNSSKSDFSSDCKAALGINENAVSLEEFKMIEEYALNYKSTTRWQTI